MDCSKSQKKLLKDYLHSQDMFVCRYCNVVQGHGQ